MSSPCAPKQDAPATAVVFKKQDPSKKGFSDLSGELRNTIYRLSLVGSIPIALDVLNSRTRVYYRDDNVVGLYKPTLDITTALLQTSKAINIESTSILVGENTFVIDADGSDNSNPEGSFRPQPLPNLTLIRRLVIRHQPATGAILRLTGNVERRLTVLENVLGSIEQLGFCTLEIYSRRNVIGEYTHDKWVELLEGTFRIVDKAKCTQATGVLVSHRKWGSVPKALWKETEDKAARAIASRWTSNTITKDLPVPRVWSRPTYTFATITDDYSGTLSAFGSLSLSHPLMMKKVVPCNCFQVSHLIIEEVNKGTPGF